MSLMLINHFLLTIPMVVISLTGRWVTGYAPSSNANPDFGLGKRAFAINLGVDFVLW